MKQHGKCEIPKLPAERRTGASGAWLVRRVCLVLVAVLGWGLAGAQAETTNAPARLDFNSFRMISDRNIFNPSRYARNSSRPRTDSRSASRVEYFTLVGLMAYEKGVFAFFDGTAAGYKKTLQGPGDISEFKVTSITPDQLQLVSGTNEFVMRVGMQVRREDEGDWFLTEAGAQTTRNRVVVSRGRSRSSTGESATGLPEGVDGTGMEGEPEIIVLEPETTSEANGNGEAAAAEPADNGTGITDPVLLRLMQRRQELSQ
jgi:hypothetical protein